MAEQVINLGPSSGWSGDWRGAVVLNDVLTTVDGSYLRRITLPIRTTIVRVRLSRTASENPDTAGPDFDSKVEKNPAAFTFQEATAGTIVVPGPDAPGNTGQDSSEGYDYIVPGNIRRQIFQWESRLGGGDVMLTISDGVAPPVYSLAWENEPTITEESYATEELPQSIAMPRAVTAHVSGDVLPQAPTPLYELRGANALIRLVDNNIVLSPSLPGGEYDLTYRAYSPDTNPRELLHELTISIEQSPVITLDDKESRYGGLYFDPWMQELADEVAVQMAATIAGKRHDYDEAHISELPYYSYDVRAVAWTDTLGEAYARNSLKLASEINRLAGTEACWTLVCRSLESEGYVEYTYGGNPRQKVGTELFIVPPRGIAIDATLLGHLTHVGRSVVVPYWMELVAIHVVNRVVTVSGMYAVIHDPYAWAPLRLESGG